MRVVLGVGLAALITAAVFVSASHAASVQMQKEPLAGVVAAAACNAASWTGWVDVSMYRSIVWELFFDGDASPATTAITMRCETSDDSSTANDGGYDVHILSDSATAGTSSSVTHTWSNPVSADEKWTWTVSNLPHNYVNCLFTCTSGDSGDAITVKHKRITP